jgi:hypothetical protein
LKVRAEAAEHGFNDVVGPNTKNIILNLGRQMPIAEMPRNTHELMRILMSNLDEELDRGFNLQPFAVIKLQAVTMRHSDSSRKVEKNVFAVICRQLDAAAMARLKIKS